MSELAFLYEEIRLVQKHLKCWMRPRRVGTPFLLWPASSQIQVEPYGTVLNIAPWNYPIQLSLVPAIGALAAGNTVVLKPSELSSHTDQLLNEMINSEFPPEQFLVVSGGVEATQNLLKERFDYIFYTGSTRVGKIIMKAAAEHLTPVTLELGGKSPCLVGDDANIEISARRIIWGKFFNGGQTCVAPDYVLVPKKQSEVWVGAFKKAIVDFYGENPKASKDFARIINLGHFDRLIAYLKDGKVVHGGQFVRDQKYIDPTLILTSDLKTPLMQEEIFGPILPIIAFDNWEHAYNIIESFERPLAFYLFTSDRHRQKECVERLSFGGGCINDTLIHLNNPKLPFGGIGHSGMGAYHGKFSFETFSHHKSVLKKPFSFDQKIRYPPYGSRIDWLKKFVK